MQHEKFRKEINILWNLTFVIKIYCPIRRNELALSLYEPIYNHYDAETNFQLTLEVVSYFM